MCLHSFALTVEQNRNQEDLDEKMETIKEILMFFGFMGIFGLCTYLLYLWGTFLEWLFN